jgi:hypothetical protein
MTARRNPRSSTFVARVTKEGGPEFVPPSEGVAASDNDGTLCCEQPVQTQFFFNRVKEWSAKDPTMGDRVSLSKLSELNIFNDREAKHLSIGPHIGRRPLLAFGNSDGDLPIMRYAKSGSGPGLRCFFTMTTRSGRRLTTASSD